MWSHLAFQGLREFATELTDPGSALLLQTRAATAFSALFTLWPALLASVRPNVSCIWLFIVSTIDQRSALFVVSLP